MPPTTTFEDTGGASWTSLSNEETFLETVASETAATLSVAGRSIEDRPLWRVDLGANPANTWMIAAAQHANERASRESALIFLRDLAYSTDPAVIDYLANHRLVVMPTTNPDGIANDERQNANGVDLNRDIWALTQPESRAISDVINDARPHLFLDAHEQQFDAGTNMMYLKPELACLYPGLPTKGDELISAWTAAFDLAGISHRRYPIPGRPSLREGVATRNVLALLLETYTNGPPLDRVAYYQTALTTMREWHAAEAGSLTSLRAESRDYQATTTTRYVLQTGTTESPWPQVLLPDGLTGYELANPLPDRVVDAYGIVVDDSLVPLHQQARAVIPILLDEASDNQLVPATRILADEPAPPPPGGSTDFLPIGISQPTVHWIACELVSGRKIATLRDLSGGFGRMLGAYTTSSHELPIPSMGGQGLTLSERAELAVQSTTPYRTMLVAVINDQPTYAGIVTRRNGGTGANLALACVSIEGYLARRSVQDHTWENRDDISVIAAGLLGDAGPILGVGTGIGLEVDAPASGRSRTRHYSRRDRSSVYDRMQELMGVQNGPEWTIELLWGDDTHTWVRKVARVRPRIGVASDNPTAILSTTGEANVEYVLDEDYSEGKGANYIQAYSVGEGDDQPESDPAIAHDLLAQGWPIVEHHWQPSSTIKRKSTLNLHAQRELQLQQYGALVWSLTARWDANPHLNINWRLGDDIAWRVTGHRHPQHDDGQPGATGKGRCIGWNLDPQAGTVTPLLLDPTSGG